MSPISEVAWPLPSADGLGAWIEAAGPLAMCERGVHACSAGELAHWLHDELWQVELDGPALPGIDCEVAARARLVHEVTRWREGGAARFAEAARDHAAQQVASAPPDAQALLMELVGDATKHLVKGSTALSAFCSAMTVAWLHGGDHFDDEAYRRERAWQSQFIAADLQL